MGGYRGIFIDRIHKLANPRIVIFEPTKKYYKYLKNKYKNDKKITIKNYGLYDLDCSKKLYLSGDGSSLFKKASSYEIINLRDINSVLKSYKKIDLMSINIEGSEYALVKRLINTGLIKKIKYLQIQFHDFVPKSDFKRKRIITQLKKTHKIRYSYPFVWEGFERRQTHI